MNRSQTIVTLVVCALLAGACSRMPIPAAKNHAYSEQYVMQAAHHWDVLASHVADKMYNKMSAEMSSMQPTVVAVPQPVQPVPAPLTMQSVPMPGGMAMQSYNQGYNPALGSVPPQNITPLHVYQGASMQTGYPSAPAYNTYAAGGFQPVTASPGGAYPSAAPQVVSPGFTMAAAVTPGMPPLYIEEPRVGASSFVRSFYHLLRTHLTRKDLKLVNRPEGPYSNCYSANMPCRALEVKYDVEVVNHKDRGGPIRYPGRITAALLAGGASAYLLEEASHSGEKAWAVAPLALLGETLTAKKFYWPDETNTEVVISVSVSDGELVIFNDTSIYYVNTGDQDHYHKNSRVYKVVNQ